MDGETSPPLQAQQTKNLPPNVGNDVIETGGDATWTLSSAKKGCGVLQLRDDNLDTFWQSDGSLPHFINIQFRKVCKVREIWLYLDYGLDESYTPQQISIRSGTGFHDLEEIKTLETPEPKGWEKITFTEEFQDFQWVSHKKKNGQKIKKQVVVTKQIPGDILTNLIQIAILDNHQQGKDTHIRQIKVYGPAENDVSQTGFSNPLFHEFACIR